MKLPSKVTAYHESVIFKSIEVIKELSDPLPVLDLEKLLKSKMATISDFINALTFLYSIKKIEITANGEIKKC